jgi:hypothetical protein
MFLLKNLTRIHHEHLVLILKHDMVLILMVLSVIITFHLSLTSSIISHWS